jgi:ubiquitin fusion degradation protein 1
VEYVSPDSDKKGKAKAQDVPDVSNSKDWGDGQKLGKGAWKPSGITGAGGASIPTIPSRNGTGTASQAEVTEKRRSPSPDWGVDEDEMIIYDSD